MTVAADTIGGSETRESRRSVLVPVGFFLTGVFIVLSLPFGGGGGQSVRVLDLFGVASLLCLAHAAFHARLSPALWLTFFSGCIGLMLVLNTATQDPDPGRVNILVRLVLSVSTGLFVAWQAVRLSQIRVLALGFWCGAFLACLMAYGQLAGLGTLMALAPVDRTETTIQGVLRPSAIWGHPNAAAQATMAGAAMVLLAWEKRSRMILLPVLMYGMIVGLNYLVMQNRSPLVVGGLICLVMTLRQPGIFLRLAAAVSVGWLAALLILDPQSLAGERWSETYSGLSTAEQAAQRINSAIAGMTVAFEAPLGHALAEREAKMLAQAGVRASHNGYVHAFLVLGPWFALFLFAALFAAVVSGRRPPFQRRYGLAMGSVCAMLMFEDAIFEPTITTILVLIASLAVAEKRALDRQEAGAG